MSLFYVSQNLTLKYYAYLRVKEFLIMAIGNLEHYILNRKFCLGENSWVFQLNSQFILSRAVGKEWICFMSTFWLVGYTYYNILKSLRRRPNKLTKVMPRPISNILCTYCWYVPTAYSLKAIAPAKFVVKLPWLLCLHFCPVDIHLQKIWNFKRQLHQLMITHKQLKFIALCEIK